MYKAGQVILFFSSLWALQCSASPVQVPPNAVITAAPERRADGDLKDALPGFLTDASQLEFDETAIRSAVQSISERLDGVNIGTVSGTGTIQSGLNTILASQLASLMPSVAGGANGIPQTVSLSICVPTPGSWAQAVTSLADDVPWLSGLFGSPPKSTSTISSDSSAPSSTVSGLITVPASDGSLFSPPAASPSSDSSASLSGASTSSVSVSLDDGLWHAPSSTITSATALPTDLISPVAGQDGGLLHELNELNNSSTTTSTTTGAQYMVQSLPPIFPPTMVTSVLPTPGSERGSYWNQYPARGAEDHADLVARNEKDGSIFGGCSSPQINGHPIRRDESGNIVIFWGEKEIGGFGLGGLAKARRSYWFIDDGGCL